MIRILVISLLGLVAGAPLDQQPPPCGVCHLLVKEVQDYLTTDQSKSSIESYVADTCSKLPGPEKDICLEFTRTYAGSFYAKLNSDLTPSQLCGTIPDICSESQEQGTNEKVQGPVECAICELAVLGIDRIVKTNRSSAAVNSTLEKFCNGLPAELSGPCQKIEPEILRGLTAGFDPKVACRFVKLCLADSDDAIKSIPCDACHTAIDAMGITHTDSICKQVEACETETETMAEPDVEAVVYDSSVKADAGCEICELIVTFLDQLIQDNKTANTINSTLYEVCNALPAAVKTLCLGVVPQIENAIATGVDPKQACVATKFCPNGTDTNACELCTLVANNNRDNRVNELVLDTTCTILCHTRERRSVPTYVDMEQVETMLKPCLENTMECGAVACEACKLLIGGIDGLVGSNVSTGAVDKAMTDICDKMAGESTKDACLKTVPKIVELLQNGVSPADACKVIGLCSSAQPRTSSKRKVHSRGFKRIFNKDEQKHEKLTNGDDVECELCENLGQAIDFLLADNKSIVAINSTLYSICVNLPADNLKQMCLAAGPKLLVAMKNGFNVSEVCVKLNLCPKYSTEAKPSEIKLHANGFQRIFHKEDKDHKQQVDLYCDICEFVVGELDKVLEENSTQEQINATVYDTCNKLQGAFQDLCLKTAPQIVSTVEKGADPKQACTLINLCKPANETPKTSQLKVDVLCDTCDFVIRELDKVLAENATRDNINTTVYGICAKLQGTFNGLCLVAAPKIVDAIVSGVDPKQVCVLVTLCPAISDEASITSQLKVDILCDTCDFVIHELDKVLAENATHDNINTTVYGICDKLQGTFNGLCLVAAPKIVDAIVTGVDPKQVCVLVTLCPATSARIERTTVKDEGDLKCDICKYVVTEADKRIGKNSSIAKINETVYDLCNKLTTVSIKILCLAAAPEIVKELANGGDPDKVCQNIKMCTPPVELQHDLPCDICIYLVTETEKRLSLNATIDKINETMLEICSDLFGNLKTLCYAATPQIVSALETNRDPRSVCSKVGYCDKQGSQDQSPNPNNLKDIKCDICEFAIKEIDVILQRNGTGDINDTVYGVCAKLSGTLQNFCLTYAPQIIKALEGGVQPDKACEVLRLCTSTTGFMPSELISTENENLRDIKCDLCEFAIQEIESIIQKNGTGDINATVYGVCAQLTGALQTFCLTYAPKIVQVLEAGTDPEKACQVLKLCTGSTGFMPSGPISTENENLKDIKCDLCEFAIQEIESIIQRNGTGDINATVYGVCAQLTGTLQTFCLTYAPKIVQVLEAGTDPEKACQVLKLCTGSTGFMPSGPISTENENLKDIKCELCEIAIQEVESIIQRNGTGDINATVYGICAQLTGTLQTICLAYAPKIVQVLRAGTAPEKACQELNLCSSITEVETSSISHAQENWNGIECDICEFAIKEIDAILQKNGTGKDINDTVYGVCGKLSGTLQSLCNKFAPNVVKVLEQGVDPKLACTAIKLCTSTDSIQMPVMQTKNNLKDIKCDVCEFAITEIDAILQRNGTGDINATVYGVCDNLPGTLQQLCYQFAPKVVTVLEQGVDPKTACAAIRLCTSTDSIEMPVIEINNNLKDIKCDVCEFAIKEIDAILQRNGTGDINATVYGVCENLPGTLQQLCYQFAPKVVTVLEQGVDPETACTAIRLCTSTDSIEMPVIPMKSNLKDIKCDVCEFAIKEIDAILQRNGTGDINATVYGVCENLPGTLQQLCYQFAPKVVTVLEQGVDPKTACAAIRLCTSTDSIEMPVIPIKSNLKDIKCDVCEFAIKEIDAILQRNGTGDINATVYGVCENLPGTLQHLCYQFAPKVVTVLEQGVDPKTACAAIRLCTSTDSIQMPVIETKNNLKDIKCDICEYAIKEIDAILQRNGTGDINATVYGVCDNLPGTLQQLCYQFAPKVVTVLEQGVDPETACTAIRLCTSTDTIEMPVIQMVNNLNGIECDICEFAIKEIDAILQKNGTDKNINDTVYGVCGKLSGTLQQLCDSFAPAVVTVLEGGVDPKTACTVIKLCTSTEFHYVAPSEEFLDCGTCQRALQTVYSNVEQDYPKVRRVLEQLCDGLSPNAQSTCKGMLEEDNGVVFKTLLQNYTPVLMCEMAQCVEN